MAFLANSNGGSMEAILPTVASSVAATASKMQLRQKEELVWHHAVRMGDWNGLGTPVHSDTGAFINQVVAVIWAWGLKIVVWQKRKISVTAFVAIFILDCMPIGFEALVNVILWRQCWNDAKQDVIFHEIVHWSSVNGKAVDQDSKISVGEGWMRLDQSVKLASVGFFLQLQQDVFLVFEEGIDNILGVLSSGEAAGKEGESTATNRHLTVHLNGVSIWQR